MANELAKLETLYEIGRGSEICIDSLRELGFNNEEIEQIQTYVSGGDEREFAMLVSRQDKKVYDIGRTAAALFSWFGDTERKELKFIIETCKGNQDQFLEIVRRDMPYLVLTEGTRRTFLAAFKNPFHEKVKEVLLKTARELKDRVKPTEESSRRGSSIAVGAKRFREESSDPRKPMNESQKLEFLEQALIEWGGKGISKEMKGFLKFWTFDDEQIEAILAWMQTDSSESEGNLKFAIEKQRNKVNNIATTSRNLVHWFGEDKNGLDDARFAANRDVRAFFKSVETSFPYLVMSDMTKKTFTAAFEKRSLDKITENMLKLSKTLAEKVPVQILELVKEEEEARNPREVKRLGLETLSSQQSEQGFQKSVVEPFSSSSAFETSQVTLTRNVRWAEQPESERRPFGEGSSSSSSSRLSQGSSSSSSLSSSSRSSHGSSSVSSSLSSKPSSSSSGTTFLDTKDGKNYIVNNVEYVLSQMRPFTSAELARSRKPTEAIDRIALPNKRLCRNIQMHGLIKKAILDKSHANDSIVRLHDWNMFITREHIESLYGNGWLDVSIINAVAAIYNSKSGEGSTYFLTTCIDENSDGISSRDLERVGKYCFSDKRPNVFLVPYITNAKYGGSHFVSFVVDIHHKNVHYYDSLGDQNTFPKEYFEHVRNAFQKGLQIDISAYEKLVHDGPNQRDVYNCGLFSLLFFEYYLNYEQLLPKETFVSRELLIKYRLFILSLIYNRSVDGNLNDIPLEDVNKERLDDYVKREVDRFKYGMTIDYGNCGFDIPFEETCKSLFPILNECSLPTIEKSDFEGYLTRDATILKAATRKTTGNHFDTLINEITGRECNDCSVTILDFNEFEKYGFDNYMIGEFDLVIILDKKESNKNVPYFFFTRNMILATYCRDADRKEEIKDLINDRMVKDLALVQPVIYVDSNSQRDFTEDKLSVQQLEFGSCKSIKRYVANAGKVVGVQRLLFNPGYDHDVQALLMTDCIMLRKGFNNTNDFLAFYARFLSGARVLNC